MNKIKKFEIVGIIFSIIFGSLLHFVYAWSGNNSVVAIFGAVNESTWEHLKIAFWPTFLFLLIEYLLFRRDANNFWFAGLAKLLSIPALIAGLFYGWLAIFPDSLYFDISIFIFAIIIGYLISLKIICSRIKYGFEAFSGFLIILILAAFAVFTYFPPQYFLFRDPVSGDYGISR